MQVIILLEVPFIRGVQVIVLLVLFVSMWSISKHLWDHICHISKD